MPVRSFHFLALLALWLILAVGCTRKLPDPLSPQEHLRLGMAHELHNDPERATQEYKKALPHDPRAALYLGNLCYTAGKEEEALRFYRAAHEHLPDDPHINNNLAWALFQAGQRTNDSVQLQEAETLAQRAVDAATPELREYCEDTLAQIRRALKRPEPVSAPKDAAPVQRRRQAAGKVPNASPAQPAQAPPHARPTVPQKVDVPAGASKPAPGPEPSDQPSPATP